MNRREFIAAGLSTPLLRNVFLEFSSVTSHQQGNGREIVWRRIKDNLSFEQARIVKAANGAGVSGTVLAAQGGVPLRVEYLIECDPRWQTRRVHVEQSLGGVHGSIRLERDENGRWLRNGADEKLLQGCIDVDLGITPSTNALPVNRLRLPVGASSEIDAAWIRFPELTVMPARQSYRRLSEREYEYRNVSSGFTAALAVDEDGLPTDYGGIWSRIAEGPAAQETAGFAGALISPTPSKELGDAAEALGWLVGGWSAEVRDFDAKGNVRSGTGEWWFSWVLEGRAMQDVWIVPTRAQRSEEHGPLLSGSNDRYGSTVRWFDRAERQWKMVWINPVSGKTNTLAGGRQGDRVVLEGEEDGHPLRWSFNDIRPNSFVWRGETHASDGLWRLDAEFRLKRIA
jgi:hypothetical protein